MPDAGIHDAEIVVYFSNRRHRGTWIVGARFLINRNCRRKASDFIYVWLRHLIEELSRIRRKRLHISALAFGKNRIKSQRRFPASRDASDSHYLVAWHFNCNIFEVMSSCPYHPYFVYVFLYFHLNFI